MTFDEAEAFAESKGGRLPTAEEVSVWLASENKGKPIFPGQDQWTAVRNPDGTRDYIQVGSGGLNDNDPGQSHVEKYGFPDWADTRNEWQSNASYFTRANAVVLYANLTSVG